MQFLMSDRETVRLMGDANVNLAARIRELEKENAAIKARCEELEEALKPFAEYVNKRGEAMSDEELMDGVVPSGPTLGHCRRAAALLRGGTEG